MTASARLQFACPANGKSRTNVNDDPMIVSSRSSPTKAQPCQGLAFTIRAEF
jgi:hypothetical protein